MSLKNLFKTNIFRGIFILIIFLCYAICGTLATYLFKYAINDLTKGNWDRFVFWLVIDFIVSILTVLTLPLGTFLFNKQVQECLHNIRSQIMRRYYNSGGYKVSEIQNELGNNLKILTDDYATPWIQIWTNLLSLIFAIGTLITLHWSLILFVAVAAIIVLTLPKIMTKKLSNSTAAAAKKNAQLLNTIENWFSGLSELRRYSASGRLDRALGQDSRKLAEANVYRKKVQGISISINGLGNAIGQIGSSLFSGLLFFNHIITLGDWFIAGSFASTIFNGLWEVINAMTQMRSTKKLRQEIADLTKSIPEKKPGTVVYGVECHNLKVQYQNGESISYPDFTINKGDKVLLSGDSGTGKSTLFKVLLGQLKPKTGEVYFTAQDGTKISPQQARLGYVAQDATLFPDTIANNITMFNSKLVSKLKEAVQKVQLVPDLAKFPNQINTTVDLDQGNLSGGQRQKVVLARAEIHDEPFLLLDEATSAVDSKSTSEIIGNLLDTDKTLLMIAHNFSPELKDKFDYQINLKSNKKSGNQNDN